MFNIAGLLYHPVRRLTSIFPRLRAASSSASFHPENRSRVTVRGEAPATWATIEFPRPHIEGASRPVGRRPAWRLRERRRPPDGRL